MRQCAGGVAARVEGLVRTLQQAGRDQVGASDIHALRENVRIFPQIVRWYSSSAALCFIRRCPALSPALPTAPRAAINYRWQRKDKLLRLLLRGRRTRKLPTG